MKSGRRNHTAQFKAKVAVEALKGLKTTNELATQYEVHPTQITRWRRQMLEQAPDLFPTDASATGRTTRISGRSFTSRSGASRSSWTG